MKKNPCPKIGFRISSETSNGYKHLSFQFLKRGEYNLESMEELAVIRFQSDATNKGWYGMRTTIEARGNPINHVSDALKLLKKLTPENVWEETPETILAKMAELKIERVEYDSRLSQFVTEKNLPESSLTRWMDGYRNYNADYGCSIAVLAENENDARNKIQKEFAENVAKGGSMQTFEKWIASGKPVEQNERNFYKPAVFGCLESILKPLAWITLDTNKQPVYCSSCSQPEPKKNSARF